MDASLFINTSHGMDQVLDKLVGELLKEIRKPEDNAKAVLDILHRNGFYSFSEDTKLFALRYKARSVVHNSHNVHFVWRAIMEEDKVNTMKAYYLSRLCMLSPVMSYQQAMTGYKVLNGCEACCM